MLLNLTLKPSYSAKLTTVCTVVSIVGGLIIYGTGYMDTTGDLLISIIRTPFSVIGMFLGRNDLLQIDGAAIFDHDAGIVLFWILQLLAFYSTASAVMITIGSRALRHLRSLLSRRGDLCLIYGLNDRSISIGRECRAARMSVIFLTAAADDTSIREINNMGMQVLAGQDAVNPTVSWVRKALHPGKRKISIYGLEENEDRNLRFALQLRDALKTIGIRPENTRISLPGVEDILTGLLQVSEEEYGYGHVYVYDRAMLAARALIRYCPPWDYMHFDRIGRAVEDFGCVIVGFGLHGQAVLKQLIMNGQYVGSTFHAAVFSPDYQNEAGYLMADSPGLPENYDIRFFAGDGRGTVFYDYLSENLSKIRMIVVCTGSEEMNREISDNLMMYLHHRDEEQILVVRCGDYGIRYQEEIGSPIISRSSITLEMLSAENADRSAIILNSTYDRSERTDWQKWVACDSFSKMSSRASADFLPAFIRISGSSREEILSGNWHPDEQMQDVLGQTEHLRWSAFHYTMGYRAMSKAELEERGERCRRSIDAGEPCSIRLTKDTSARRLACKRSPALWSRADHRAR